MEQDKDLNNAIVENLRLKSRILIGIFSIILLGQFIIFLYLFFKTNLLGTVIPKKAMVIGPAFLLTIILSEFFFARKLKNFRNSGSGFPRMLPYFVVMVECSFPTTFILIASQFLHGSEAISPQQLITSPPLIMYIIMIILSSLTLDLRLSIFAGLVSGAEYLAISSHLLKAGGVENTLDFTNVIFRSALIFLCGVIAGLISKKIREAVQSSLRDKNALINKLDELVHEKTAEIRVKNEMLEEKQLEIRDSMHYAKRIQDSQLPNEKMIGKNLERLKNK
ncbi:MAG TPA: hypothetical protein VL651_14890 [Bacteroidia bacterium]|nr:hypothetical protein [Bacteroidia bacterium]